MLEGFTQEELDKFAAECREKYEKKIYDLMLHAADGEGVTSYDELIRELKQIDFFYANEAEDYIRFVLPITLGTCAAARKAEGGGGIPVKEFAYQWLQFQMDIAEPNSLVQLGL